MDSRHSVAQLSCLLQKACSRSYNRITALTARCRCWYSRASALLQRWNCSICRYDSSRSGTVRSHRDAKGAVVTLISVVPGSASCRMCMRYNMSTPEHRSQGPLLHMQQSAELQHIIQTRFHLFEAFKSCVAAADGLLTGGNLRVKHRQAACSRGPTGLLCSSSLLLLCQQPILLMLRVCRWGSSQHGSMLAHMGVSTCLTLPPGCSSCRTLTRLSAPLCDTQYFGRKPEHASYICVLVGDMRQHYQIAAQRDWCAAALARHHVRLRQRAAERHRLLRRRRCQQLLDRARHRGTPRCPGRGAQVHVHFAQRCTPPHA